MCGFYAYFGIAKFCCGLNEHFTIAKLSKPAVSSAVLSSAFFFIFNFDFLMSSSAFILHISTLEGVLGELTLTLECCFALLLCESLLT
jgi:hypothetical protein